MSNNIFYVVQAGGELPACRSMVEMAKWVNTGVYVSKNTEKQKRLIDVYQLLKKLLKGIARIKS